MEVSKVSIRDGYKISGLNASLGLHLHSVQLTSLNRCLPGLGLNMALLHARTRAVPLEDERTKGFLVAICQKHP